MADNNPPALPANTIRQVSEVANLLATLTKKLQELSSVEEHQKGLSEALKTTLSQAAGIGGSLTKATQTTAEIMTVVHLCAHCV